jgi:hypothetical protein
MQSFLPLLTVLMLPLSSDIVRHQVRSMEQRAPDGTKNGGSS